MLLVVDSCERRLLSSSTSASILEEDRQLSRLSLPRIPCRTLNTFSSNSRAGASKSIINGKWQTGQAGYEVETKKKLVKKNFSITLITNLIL